MELTLGGTDHTGHHWWVSMLPSPGGSASCTGCIACREPPLFLRWTSLLHTECRHLHRHLQNRSPEEDFRYGLESQAGLVNGAVSVMWYVPHLWELLPWATCRTCNTGAVRVEELCLITAELRWHQHTASLRKNTHFSEKTCYITGLT